MCRFSDGTDQDIDFLPVLEGPVFGPLQDPAAFNRVALDQPDARERLAREARSLSRLSHPHICAVHDVGEDGGSVYLVMELLEGETLTARIARGPLGVTDTLRIGREIAEARA